MGTAQKDVSRKKTRGWDRGESEGKPVRLFNKSSSCIPYDWSILTALVSAKRFITLIGDVMQ